MILRLLSEPRRSPPQFAMIAPSSPGFCCRRVSVESVGLTSPTHASLGQDCPLDTSTTGSSPCLRPLANLNGAPCCPFVFGTISSRPFGAAGRPLTIRKRSKPAAIEQASARDREPSELLLHLTCVVGCPRNINHLQPIAHIQSDFQPTISNMGLLFVPLISPPSKA